MGDATATALLDSLFAGEGEMCHLMRSHDWSQTPLGPVEQWPQSLRTTVSIILNSRYPMFVWWGPHHANLYNDAYRPILGANKHPQFLGQSAKVCWAEIWDVVGVMAERVIGMGESTWAENLLLVMARYGYLEETYFTFSYSPVRDESGGVGGVFCACTETTSQVVGERRLRTLRDLAAQAGQAKTADAACQIALNILANNPADIPFALLYMIDANGESAHLAGTTGLAPDTPASPSVISLQDTHNRQPWPLAQVAQQAQGVTVTDVIDRFGPLAVGPWPESPHTALVLPVASPGQVQPTGLLIAGINARRALDDDYQGFLELVAGQIAAAIADARAYEAERQRAEALAAIDRAKTLFFSNVSHEFRTPLTLMLAPLEDALADYETPLPPVQSERLVMAQRNGLRLLKLVNTLLDFSRIEAGRMQAMYEPTDLASFTAELASTFRSLIERAGLTLAVDCPPLPSPVYVDRELWEKIVLNLLSNAFKFTFTGTITVRLQAFPDRVELVVADTGIGIPAAELPHLFERFHRVKEAQGRSFEGSGIGLSLVQELVKLHGGTVQVTSALGQGSCFTVSIPLGTAHLPSDRLGTPRTLASTALGAQPFVEEAGRWLPMEAQLLAPSPIALELQPAATAVNACFATPPRVLVVDDNADMRDYLRHLLEPHYVVTAAPDGVVALATIAATPPDLVLTDVMMPRLDGFGLLRELRANPQTRALPILLLSARAGEEARVEGLAAGADDYLIKPFSARELLARVEAHLKMVQLRQEAAVREQGLRLMAEQAQQAAEATAARLIEVLESMGDSFVALDHQWRILYQNAASERINAKPRGEVLGKTLWEEWPAAVGSNLEVQYRRAMTDRIPVHFEHRYYEPPDHDVWLEIDVYPFQDGLSIFYRDVSDRKQAEETLRVRERFFTTLAEVLPVAIFRFDRANHCTYVNTHWSEMTGRPVADALGMGWLEALHPEDRDRLTQAWQQWCQSAQPLQRYQNEGRSRQPDGSVVWYYIQALPEVDQNGNIVGYVGVLTDITALKQTEAALRESQSQLYRQLAEIEAIYQSAPIGLNFLDTDLRFVRINERLAEINGLPVAAHIGHTIRELLPALADEAEALLRPILVTGQPLLNVEISGETPAQPGVKRIWLESFLPLKEGDRVIGINTVCEEITERKQAEAALQQAKADLEQRVAERTAELRRINTELQQSESTLRSFFDSSVMPMGIVELHDDDIFQVDANEAAARFLGMPLAALKQQWVSRLGVPPEITQAWLQRYQEAARTQAPVHFEYWRTHRGEQRWLAGSIGLITGVPGSPPRFSYILADVTDRKRAEEQLQYREEQLRLALEFGQIGTWDWDIATGQVIWNDNHFRLLGLMPNARAADLYGCWREAVHPDDREWVEQALHRALQTHTDYDAEYRIHYPDGTLHWLAGKGRGLYTEAGEPLRMLGVLLDVSDRKQAQERLTASLKEKEVLLKEVHHRVKNNLGIVSSLLQMQARRVPDGQTKAILRDCQNRIASIALVHEKLYRSEDLANINFSQYIHDLTMYLFDSYNINSTQIKLNIELDKVNLDIETAIPCGLIINELVSNAMKYAFPGDRPGEIWVKCYQAPAGWASDQPGTLTLRVGDNGIGLPSDFDLKRATTLGITLVQGLVQQLRGTMIMSNPPDHESGLEFEIMLPQKFHV